MWFHDTRIIHELLKYEVYNTLAYLGADLSQKLLWSMWVSFSNNIDLKIGVDPMLDNFGSDSVVFLFFPRLDSFSKISMGPMYYIVDLLFLEYSLGKIGPLRPIFKVTELLSLALAVILSVYYFDSDLDEGKKCSTCAAERISDLITW